MLQRQPIQKLHGDERLPVLLANVVNRANIGVVECRRCAGFTTKSFESLRVLRQFIRQELQGYKSPKLGVLGFVNDTHAAAAQLLDDAVMRNGLAHKLGRRSHGREC